jgi:hypothetical protein
VILKVFNLWGVYMNRDVFGRLLNPHLLDLTL